MANFAYQAINASGANISGTVRAESATMAENILSAQGHILTAISVAAPTMSLWERMEEKLGSVKPTELIVFTKQFRSMLHAGIPIMRILQVLEAQTENKILKKVVVRMGEDIQQGATLFDALEKHPAVFSQLYRSMVKAGELSGALPDVLSRLVYIIEHETKIKSDIKSALQYPKMVVGALSVAFFVLLTFVIPKFVAIFAKAGLSLPLPTKIAMFLYQFLANYWYVLILAVVGVFFALRTYFKTTSGRLQKDAFLLKMPIFGPLFNKAALSRFASIFAILHSSGVPVIQTMGVLAGTIGNAAISREFERVRMGMEQGGGISGPLSTAKYFTPMVVDMVAIGEESGNIEDMLREVTIHYDDEVNYAVKGLSDALGPILLVGLASVVGFFALAIFLPMWDLTKMVK
jgi:type II secretory pathway component PulF